MSPRAERVLSLEQAAAVLRDGMVVGLSGFSYQNPPMALVRAIIRRGVRDLTVVSGPTAGLETDLLIGAGCVRRVVTAGVAFEGVVGIAPAFRWGAERSGLSVWECDECVWHLALKAAAWGMPHVLWRGGVGSSLPELNPDLQEVTEEGRRFIRVPPVRPDVVFLHAAEADPYGNVRAAREAYLGRTFAERSLVAACRGPVVATVERIVTNEEVAASPERTVVRGAAVVLAPWGAHPGGVSGRYVPDLSCYRDYVEAGESLRRGDASAYRRYLDRHVFEPVTHEEYVKRLDPQRLERLAMARA